MVGEEDAVSALLSQSAELEEPSSSLSAFEEEQVSTLLLGSQRRSNHKTDHVLFPEEAAWADSCLAFVGSEFSDDDWKALRDALLETQSAPEPLHFANSSEMIDPDEMEQEEVTKPAISTANTEVEEDVLLIREELQQQLLVPVDADADALETVLDPQEDIESHESIFKLWDLQPVDEEEDELMKQLKKALPENNLKLQPAAAAVDSRMAFKDEGIDELAEGMARLFVQEPKGY